MVVSLSLLIVAEKQKKKLLKGQKILTGGGNSVHVACTFKKVPRNVNLLIRFFSSP